MPEGDAEIHSAAPSDDELVRELQRLSHNPMLSTGNSSQDANEIQDEFLSLVGDQNDSVEVINRCDNYAEQEASSDCIAPCHEDTATITSRHTSSLSEHDKERLNRRLRSKTSRVTISCLRILLM